VTLLTIGHSTRRRDELLSLLHRHAVTTLVDVRRYPGSRRFPHFGGPALRASLLESGIAYVHEPDLGGHRDPMPGSPNSGWRIPAFRGYADHMATPEFQRALVRVIARAGSGRVCLMCAEALPTRCHRQLLADFLVASGHEVLHVLGDETPVSHLLNPMATVEGGLVTYPAPSRKSQTPLFYDREP
jgi:uncharacterized protein (DUF488 family)